MTVTIGIFKKEESVLDAIKRFQANAWNDYNLRIVVKNKESAPILASQSDVPVEEVYEIREAQEPLIERAVPPVGAVPLAAGGYTAGSIGASGSPTGFVPIVNDPDQYPSTHDVLHDIGIPAEHAKECGDAVELGRYLLIIETESAAEAETLLRQAGAANVVI
ncbi:MULTISPECIES: hypothetical protein [Bacillales]|uniref:hypothetical protein n=1 Tax=Bacillales TaxID=1385 RepID=UPI0006A7C436|nr:MULTISPECIES: hypothetical protein [Bacillales]OBZ11280.1 hypothetical protein A7975_20250 [Bacillus sp. FJAT-26390]